MTAAESAPPGRHKAEAAVETRIALKEYCRYLPGAKDLEAAPDQNGRDAVALCVVPKGSRCTSATASASPGSSCLSFTEAHPKLARPLPLWAYWSSLAGRRTSQERQFRLAGAEYLE